jgi:clan AA aspartic protease (TIGR02281 family)
MNGDFCVNTPLHIQRQGGHYYVTILAVYSGRDAGNEKINFILDTGAFITVVSRDTAKLLGYNKLPRIVSKIKGYTGEAPADFVRIPSLKILDTRITDVPVLIPHSSELKQNILGLNVLEYFNYYVDTCNNAIYLSLNPSPQHYHSILACGQVTVESPK